MIDAEVAEEIHDALDQADSALRIEGAGEAYKTRQWRVVQV
ncbi:hypothetical protein [Alkalilimnicola ehrlichii]|nr:hypothetical protein [Alkalilimnicola ehrlichii]